MKPAHSLAFASLPALLLACGGAGDPGAEPGSAADEVNAAATVLPGDVTSVKNAFTLRDGASEPAALRAGDCYKALVAPVEGIPEFLVKQYANGAIMYPNPYPAAAGEPGPLCVDVHAAGGATAISLSGVQLDAVARWGLGRYEGTALRATEHGEELDIAFANGSMHVFRDLRDPFNGRYTWATRPPTGAKLITAAPAIAGSLTELRLDGVRVTTLSGAEKTRSLTVDGPTVLLAYRHAYASTKAPQSYAMNDAVIGIFERSARVVSDAGTTMHELHFSKSELRKTAIQDPSTDREMIEVLPADAPTGAVATIACKRDVPADRAPAPYACTGLE